jgi:hypothetical protein
MTDWIILSSGILLCWVSAKILATVAKLRQAYARKLRYRGVDHVPLAAAELLMFLTHGAAFAAGCALIVWGWDRVAWILLKYIIGLPAYALSSALGEGNIG